MPAHVIEVPCHSISGLRQSYNFMSSVNYYLIIGSFLSTLCAHVILPFMFMFMFQFVFIFHIIFMFHEHIYTYCISYIFLFHAYCIWHFIYLYSMTPMYSHIIHVVFSLYDFTYKLESFQLNHPNSSYGFFMSN